MDNKELRQIIQEQFQSVFQESENESLNIDTQKLVDNLSKEEDDLAMDILGDGMLEEGSFSKLREKFNKALKSGAMTLGVLAAVLSTPDMAQAQKEELKKDVTNSTWFLDSQKDFNNEKMGYSALVGDYVDNPDFDQDVYNKSVEDRNYNPVSLEKWVNNLGQDSTVWKQYQDKEWKRGVDGVGKSTYSNPTVSKTVVNKDVKPWAGENWSQLTKKGNIGNYLWSKDKTKSITPEVHKELKKLDKGKKVDYKDWKSTQAKQYKDAGMSASDFQSVDLDNIQSPIGLGLSVNR
jgi:hypothetical protein